MDGNDYYEERLFKLKSMIQQDIWTNRADMECGKVAKVYGELLESVLIKYIEKIERW